MSVCSILLLEDESVIALDVASMLEAQGFDPVIVCNTAESATRAIDLALPDVGILDIGLAERQKRVAIAKRLAGQSCPVLLLADHAALLEDLPDALQFCEVIEKPFSDTCVLRSVETLVARNGLRGVSLGGDADAEFTQQGYRRDWRV